MPWVKLDDQFTDHPKVVQAGPLAGWLYVCGLSYCARQLTDGFIPGEQVRRLLPSASVGKLAARLVDVGLWETVPGGYAVHDYLIYNATREQTLALRKQRADAGRKGGWQKAGTLPSTEPGECQALANTPVPIPVPSPVPHEASTPTDLGSQETNTGGNRSAIARARQAAALVPVNGRYGSPQAALKAVAQIAFGFTGQTDKERERENKAIHQLVKAGVTPDELQDLIVGYRRRGWPNPSLSAVAGRLGQLRAPDEPGRRPAERDEPRGLEGIREVFADVLGNRRGE